MHKQITLQAKATATDQGSFVAIAAAYSVDRAGDRIVPGAFKGTIERWQASSKRVPLHWDHESGPESIIGTVDPLSMHETDAGLQVAGALDLSSAKAKEAWRAMKTGSLSLSFGYMATKQRKGEDGVVELVELDLFEISIVPAPANADTRFLELKSVPEMEPAEIREELAELRKRIDELEGAQDDTPADDDDETEQTFAVTQQASDPEATAIDLALIEALNV